MIGRIIRIEQAPKAVRLIVCGGRNYGCAVAPGSRVESKRVELDRRRLFEALDALVPREIAHGGATGADALAGEWASARDVPCRVFPEGRESMFGEFRPDGVVSFPGGTGTADMESIALNGGAWLVRIR